MSQQGATLQGYNNELVKCIEDLRRKREELQESILVEEESRGKLQRELHELTEKIGRVTDSLARKVAARNEYDRTISETEAAYAKILESSQTLLHVLKKGAATLGDSR